MRPCECFDAKHPCCCANKADPADDMAFDRPALCRQCAVGCEQ